MKAREYKDNLEAHQSSFNHTRASIKKTEMREMEKPMEPEDKVAKLSTNIANEGIEGAALGTMI